MQQKSPNVSVLEQLYKNCRLCPRECGVDRAFQKGFCSAGIQMQISRIAPHYDEEPPISGTNGSGAVFFNHCNLGCVYCQNQQISKAESCGRIFTAKALAEKLLLLQKTGVHNINLVTATHYLPGVITALLLAREWGLTIPVIYNCGGFEKVQSLRLLKGLIDVYLPDLKYFSPYLSGCLSRTEDYFDTAVPAIDEMVLQQPKLLFDENGLLCKGVVIRHLVLPGQTQDSKQVLRTIAKRWGGQVLVSLMRQYTPIGSNLPFELHRTVTAEEYAAVLAELEDLGLDGFSQQKESASAKKIPAWNQFSE